MVCIIVSSQERSTAGLGQLVQACDLTPSCLKKNLNAPRPSEHRPSEHPPVVWKGASPHVTDEVFQRDKTPGVVLSQL